MAQKNFRLVTSAATVFATILELTLDALTEFVDAQDKAKPVRWPKVSGLHMLKHLLAEHCPSDADRSRILGGSRNLGAMILRGERRLTLAHVRKLAKHFNVGPELLIWPE